MLLSDFSIMYKASSDIKKGQRITKCFADVMTSNQFRRQDIENGMMFVCGCSRCMDPTEMGTGFGGLVCEECSDLDPETGDGVQKGVVLPTAAENDIWKCNNCP